MRPTQRLTAQHGALLVVDLQDKLLALIPERDAVVAHTSALIRGARALGLPVWATEQYPQGLGPTTAAVAELIPDRPAKTTLPLLRGPPAPGAALRPEHPPCHGRGDRGPRLRRADGLELLDLGFRVQVPADAVASRRKIDWEFALRRLEHAGAVVSTTESVLFEWTETSDRPEFKAISEIWSSH